jgi:hypothetical protein
VLLFEGECARVDVEKGSECVCFVCLFRVLVFHHHSHKNACFRMYDANSDSIHYPCMRTDAYTRALHSVHPIQGRGEPRKYAGFVHIQVCYVRALARKNPGIWGSSHKKIRKRSNFTQKNAKKNVRFCITIPL